MFIALDFPVPWELGKGDYVIVVVVVVRSVLTSKLYSIVNRFNSTITISIIL
jgi:hypothetical protein